MISKKELQDFALDFRLLLNRKFTFYGATLTVVSINFELDHTSTSFLEYVWVPEDSNKKPEYHFCSGPILIDWISTRKEEIEVEYFKTIVI